MTDGTYVNQTDTGSREGLPGRAEHNSWRASSVALYVVLGLCLLGGLQLFYGSYYSIHTDLGGGVLSGRLALTLGDAFADYSAYFPPAERAWFTLAAWLSDLTGLRLDLTVIFMSGLAVLFSAGLAYHIRRQTVGASPLFLIVSVVFLVVLPILYKNVFGLREHMAVLGLWPYLVLRLSDPCDTRIGRKTRLVLGVWLGAMLLSKYLYSLAVLLVEVVDAAVQRRPLVLFRIENLVAGGMVALYLFIWLGIDPSQREAIAAVVSAIDGNLTSTQTNLAQVAMRLSLAFLLLLLARLYKTPPRLTLIGFALVVSAVIVAWIQSRWYSHHLFPVTVAYFAWLWMIRGEMKLLWLVAAGLIVAKPVVDEFRNSAPYQLSAAELDTVFDQAGVSVAGKRVGILTMHPSPFNQYLAAQGAWRWIASVNNSYVAAELKPFDLPENAGVPPGPVQLQDPGRQMLHDEMLRLWEDVPPDVLILDHSTNWPLQHVDVEWTQVFAQDARVQAILAQYRPVFEHKGEMTEFRYFVRAQ